MQQFWSRIFLKCLFSKGLVPSLRLLRKNGNYEGWGLLGVFMSFGGCPWVDSGSQPLPLPLLLPGHEVNELLCPSLAAMKYYITIGPRAVIQIRYRLKSPMMQAKMSLFSLHILSSVFSSDRKLTNWLSEENWETLSQSNPTLNDPVKGYLKAKFLALEVKRYTQDTRHKFSLALLGFVSSSILTYWNFLKGLLCFFIGLYSLYTVLVFITTFLYKYELYFDYILRLLLCMYA